MQEVFKDIKGFEGQYQVSNFGRIKSKNYKRTGQEKIRKIQTNRLGYQHISLWKNNEQKQFTIHNLVWVTFKGPVPKGYEINHIDENPSNNRLDNLNLLTHKENMNWGTCKERRTMKLKGKKRSEETKQKMAEAHRGRYNEHCCKVVLQYDLEGNLIKEWPSAIEIHRQLGYSRGSIGECCLGKRRKSVKGFIWKYKE